MNIKASTLGIVLAGGRSSRFGSDKALAELDGQTLLMHAVERLSLWCDNVVVAGRETAPVATVQDWPRPDCGPLGGIAGGLRHARECGLQTALSIGVDSPGLPDDLPELLSPAPACLVNQPVIGHWPTACLPTLEALLLGDGRRSMRAFAHAIGAKQVELSRQPANINTIADLDALWNSG